MEEGSYHIRTISYERATMIEGQTITLEIAGLGIIMYSPSAAANIGVGQDYLQEHYSNPDDVAEQVRNGKMVGFCTGSPGRYHLTFRCGYPSREKYEAYDLRLRLGIEVRDGRICVRDLYDLMAWIPECPVTQQVELEDGFYHISLLSSVPESSIRGRNQIIQVYLQRLDRMPELSHTGVPQLCVLPGDPPDPVAGQQPTPPSDSK
jgi:hypothetical protein